MNNQTLSFSLSEEIKRKLFHLFILLIPITYYYFGKKTSLIIFYILGLTIISLDYLRRKSLIIHNFFIDNFGKIMRNSEKQPSQMCGISFLFMAVIPVFTLAKPIIAITAFVILAISDAVASIVGKAFVSDKFFEKTFNGSLSFLTSALIIVIIAGIINNSNIIYYFFALFAVAITTIIEARPSILKIDDNFTIPASFSFLMTLFDAMWSFYN